MNIFESMGYNKEQLEKIFDPFFKMYNKRVKKGNLDTANVLKWIKRRQSYSVEDKIIVAFVFAFESSKQLTDEGTVKVVGKDEKRKC